MHHVADAALQAVEDGQAAAQPEAGEDALAGLLQTRRQPLAEGLPRSRACLLGGANDLRLEAGIVGQDANKQVGD
jgi:hypothetical protein